MILLASLATALNISDCATLDQADTWYNLTADINTNLDVCMNVTAQNVTLDCDNRVINGTAIGNYGVFVNSTSNFTLFRCNVTNWFYGVFVNSSNNTNVSYSNISGNNINLLLMNTNYTRVHDDWFDHGCAASINVSGDADFLLIKRNAFNGVCPPNDDVIYEIYFDYQPPVPNKPKNIIIEYNTFKHRLGNDAISYMISVSSNYSNLTIRHNNFNISFTQRGIEFYGSYLYQAVIYNNTFYGYTSYPAIFAVSYPDTFSGMNVSNNFFNGSLAFSGDVYDSVFYNNTVFGGGFNLWGTNSSNNLFDCAGSVMNGSIAPYSYAIGIDFGVNNTIKNCLIYDYYEKDYGYGVKVSSNSTVFNNTVKNTDTGILVLGNDLNASYNAIHDANVSVYTVYASNNVFHDNLINYSKRFAFNLDLNSYNLTSTNDVISSAVGAVDFAFGDFYYSSPTGNSSITLLNTSFNKSAVVFNESDSDSNLTVEWFVGVRVVNTIGDVVAGAEVNITDVNGTSLLNETANSTGWIPRQIITEYFQTNASVSNYTPHYFNASKTGYNSSSVVFPITADSLVTVVLQQLGGAVAPYAVAILTPANDSWTNQQYLNVTGICNSSTTPLVNVTLNYNDSSTVNASDVVNATPFYFNVSTASDGYYYYNITCYSTNSLSNTSETRLLKIDSTPPEVALTTPANGYASNETLTQFSFTATDVFSTVMNCSLFLNGTLNETNSSTFNNTATQFAVAWLPEGNTTWRVDCSDSVGNTGSSANRVVKIDRTPPSFNVTSTDVMTNLATITWVASELATSWVEYGSTTVFGTNSSANPFAINHARTLAGLSACTLYYYKLWGFDEVGNLGSSTTYSFTTQGCAGGGGGGGGGGGTPTPAASASPSPSPEASPAATVASTSVPPVASPRPTTTVAERESACVAGVASELEVKRVLTVFAVDGALHTLVNLTVTNKGARVLEEVRVSDDVPREFLASVRFINAPALFEGGKAVWFAGALAPGESKSFAYLLPGRFSASDFTIPTVSAKIGLAASSAVLLFELLLLIALLLAAVSSYLFAKRRKD